MKPSYYNFFFPYEYDKEKYIAYNSLSNSMALIEAENYQKYLDFAEKGVEIDDADLVENLKKGHFLIDDDVDEMMIIRHNMYAARFNTRSLGLTIAVTSDCNFRCVYCYEKNVINTCYMNEETEQAIIDFVEKQANTLGFFGVTWYGGEPLMNVGTIERLSKKFLEICEKNNVQYYASIVTNGYNLTKDNLDLLKRCKVSSIQITVDGDEETHNKRRPLQNGKPTFGKIMENLENLKDELIPVNLRINTDRTNWMNVESVLKILKEKQLTDKVFPYIARVENFDEDSDDDIYLSVKEYMSNKQVFENLVSKYGYTTKPNYPQRINNHCGCNVKNGYVIGSDGAMYKCWADIGEEKMSVGNINNPTLTNINNSYFEYMMFDPLLDDRCSKCKYLPICMGGCSHKKIADVNIVCDETKFNFENKLKIAAYQMKNAVATTH